MTKQIFKHIALVILIGVFCVCCKERKIPIQLPGTLLNVSDSIINNCTTDTFKLGNIKHGETVIKEFAVRNLNNKPFIINKIETDCGCLVSTFDKKPIMPEEITALSVSFASKGYYGYILKRITVMTTASATPFYFYIEAEVK